MNLLINDTPLQLLPLLAKEVGVNGAIFLQQLHFRSLVSKKIKDEHRWVCKTYIDWMEEFPFWSERTIQRLIYDLENKGYLITSSEHNHMKIDNTKWYRIHYEKVVATSCQIDEKVSSTCRTACRQVDEMDFVNLTKPITKELKTSKTKDLVEMNHDAIVSVIEYLNQKAAKQFKARTATTQKSITARLKEGYTVDDFKKVIDHKTSQWLNDPRFTCYLRPSTLFTPTNFENYLNESLAATQPPKRRQPLRPPVLDFSRGER